MSCYFLAFSSSNILLSFSYF